MHQVRGSYLLADTVMRVLKRRSDASTHLAPVRALPSKTGVDLALDGSRLEHAPSPWLLPPRGHRHAGPEETFRRIRTPRALPSKTGMNGGRVKIRTVRAG